MYFFIIYSTKTSRGELHQLDVINNCISSKYDLKVSENLVPRSSFKPGQACDITFQWIPSREYQVKSQSTEFSLWEDKVLSK